MLSNLPEEAIQEFQQIYSDQYGQSLSIGEAEMIANNLIQILHLVTSKHKENENEKEKLQLDSK